MSNMHHFQEYVCMRENVAVQVCGKRERVNINVMNRGREKVLKQERLDKYIAKVTVNKCISPERVWEYVSGLACPKVEIPPNDEELPSCFFFKFGCALGTCDGCP